MTPDRRIKELELKIAELERLLARATQRPPLVVGRGGIELSHGIILSVCNQGCSTYRVQRVHRHMRAGCDDCGSGSGS